MLPMKCGEPMSLSYRIALSCGALPLAAGTLVFVLWLAFPSDTLMGVGAIVFGLGLALFIVGSTALVRFFFLSESRAIGLMRSHGRSTVLAGILLVSNFPVALAYGAVMIPAYVVEVHNESDQMLENVRIFGGGCEESLGSLQPGESETELLRIERDGRLELSFQHGTDSKRQVIDGYVTHGQGAIRIVSVRPGSEGTLDVTSQAGPPAFH